MADEQGQTGTTEVGDQPASQEAQPQQQTQQEAQVQSNEQQRPAKEEPQQEPMPDALGEGLAAMEKQQAEQKPGAPEKYEPFKLGEDVTLDPETVEAYSKTAKELGLTQEQAQKVLDSVSPSIQSKLRADLVASSKKWREQSQKDPEIGGADFQAKMSVAVAAYQKVASPELHELLKCSGLGNHPEVIRMFYRVGKMISQDHGVTGSGPREAERKRYASWYPNSNMR